MLLVGRPFILGLVVFATVASTALAQQPTSLEGTWKINVAKSKFSPGPAPKASVITYTASGSCLTATTENVTTTGPTKVQFTCVNADGKEYPVTGSPNYDSSLYKRIDAYAAEYTRRLRGKVLDTGTRALSKDGKTLTFTAQGTDAKGQKFNNVVVFDRQ